MRLRPGLEPTRGLRSVATNGEGWFTADGTVVVVQDAFGGSVARAVPGGRVVPLDDLPKRWHTPATTSDPDVALAQWGHRSVLPTHWLNQYGPQPPAVLQPAPHNGQAYGGYSLDGATTALLSGEVVRGGEVVGSVRVEREGPVAVAISPYADAVAIGYADGTVQVLRPSGSTSVKR